MENDPNQAKILEIAKDTGKTEIFATGLRNAVFMAFHPPVAKDLWATEMGFGIYTALDTGHTLEMTI